MDKLNYELQQLLEERALRDKLEACVARSGARHRERMQAAVRLKETLDRKDLDLQKLAGLSLASLYHTLLSSKSEQLVKEREEAFQAKLAHDNCLSEMANLDAGMSAARAELKELLSSRDLDAEYTALLERLEARQRELGSPNVQRLTVLDERIKSRQAEQRELLVVGASGELAFESLDEMLKSLEQARRHLNWDRKSEGFLGYGERPSFFDNAREFACEAQIDLHHFQMDLVDLPSDEKLEGPARELKQFVDYLLDGFIYDSIMSGQVQACLAETERIQRMVHDLLERLVAQRKTIEAQLDALEADREDCVIEGV